MTPKFEQLHTFFSHMIFFSFLKNKPLWVCLLFKHAQHRWTFLRKYPRTHLLEGIHFEISMLLPPALTPCYPAQVSLVLLTFHLSFTQQLQSMKKMILKGFCAKFVPLHSQFTKVAISGLSVEASLHPGTHLFGMDRIRIRQGSWRAALNWMAIFPRGKLLDY